jgi:hypothetical protein
LQLEIGCRPSGKTSDMNSWNAPYQSDNIWDCSSRAYSSSLAHSPGLFGDQLRVLDGMASYREASDDESETTGQHGEFAESQSHESLEALARGGSGSASVRNLQDDSQESGSTSMSGRSSTGTNAPLKPLHPRRLQLISTYKGSTEAYLAEASTTLAM